MCFALIDSQTWLAAGFHAAVFVAVVVVLLALQWLFDRRNR
jgi:predicted small integral membrane protein